MATVPSPSESPVTSDPGTAPAASALLEGDRVVKAAIIGIFLILFLGLLYFAKDILLPVSLAQAVWPPVIYGVIILAEGQPIAPLLVGRRLELNVVA